MRPSRRTRAILSFAALPGMVAFAVPLLLAWAAHDARAFSLAGLIALVPGVVLLAWCARQLTAVGQGTLAPWDPPRRLVTSGPYSRSRNPMYVGVSLVLVAWALGFRSWPLALYAVLVMVAFHLRVVLAEEPRLARTYTREWPRYASHVPRWMFPNRTALAVAVVAVLAAIPIGGMFYEVYADAKASRDYPAPGMFVDVGGRRLHVICIGEGEPVIVFDAGGVGPGSTAVAALRDGLARHTRVCSYDRAGTGWSDPGPDSLSSGDLAKDLAVLQDRAGLPAPLLLVGSSTGGLTAEMFARQFPERVGGLVLLDPAHSGTLRNLEPQLGRARLAATAGSLAAYLGVFRVLDPFRIPRDSDEGRRTAAMTYGSKAFAGVRAVVAGLPRSLQEFEAAPPLPADVPMVVLSASDPDPIGIPGLPLVLQAADPERIASHRTLAGTSSRGSWQLVESGHLIAAEQPEIVTATVLTMLEQVRPARTRVTRR